MMPRKTQKKEARGHEEHLETMYEMYFESQEGPEEEQNEDDMIREEE